MYARLIPEPDMANFKLSVCEKFHFLVFEYAIQSIFNL